MGHGGMSCAMKTVRCVMVLFNILFFLIGALLLALGIYVMVDPRLQKIKEFVRIDSTPGIEKGLSYLEVLAIVLIVLGSILLIIGFLGCCGAMKQVKLFLTCYAIIIAIIIIVEVAFTIYFVVFQSKFKDQFVPKLTDSLQATYEGPLGLTPYSNKKPSPVSLAWDFIMYNFKCCGVQKPEDFYGAKAWNRTNPWQMTSPSPFSVPLTCCSTISGEQNWNDLPLDKLKAAEGCAVTGVGHPDVYKTGCYNKLVDLMDSAKIWVIVIAVVILVIELLAFIFTLALCCRQRKDTIYYSS